MVLWTHGVGHAPHRETHRTAEHTGGAPAAPMLPGFPPEVPRSRCPYLNWAGDLSLPPTWTCAPHSAEEVVRVCNWAAEHGFRIRVRGAMHGWSPITVTPYMPASNTLLVDLTQGLHKLAFIPAAESRPPRVRAGTGVAMADLLSYLEAQPGGGSAPGYSFPHTPAPGNLTLGGVLAVNGHGTAVPTPPLEQLPSGYGSMSNRIVEFTAVVTDPDSAAPTQYTLRTFQRGEGDDKAFLTHLGRALIVEAVLELVPNYMLRCQSFTSVTAETLFAPTLDSEAKPPAYSFASFVDRCGRAEVIWFPFTDMPWLHLWQVAPEQPTGSRAVNSPYNYPFADHLDPTLQAFLREACGQGWLDRLTPEFGQMMYTATRNGLEGKDFLGQSGVYPVSRDLWGPSKNLLLYMQDTTMKVTANGYAVQLKRADLQQAVHDFTHEFDQMLRRYEACGAYPVNSALRLRVTSLDDPRPISTPSGQPAQSPVISSLSQDETAAANAWDVALWLNVFTIPGTPHANEFYTELEQWLLARFSGSAGRVLPEWSKGWAYTANGPWTSQAFLSHVRAAYTDGRSLDHDWDWEARTLRRYDAANLFSNPFLDTLFSAV